MKLPVHSILLVTLVTGAYSIPAISQTDHSSHAAQAAMHAPAVAAAEMAEAVVKKIDKSTARVTLAHGPLNGMPAMTMAYRVKDVAWLDQMKPGQKILFATDPADGGMTVLRFEPVK
jgi:Cu/Ag efflux protein CusF